MSFEFDALKYSYASRRSLVYGRRGMVSTSQPLAAQAGLDIIKKGGNAVDAAIATAICMTVLEPTSNGIGSDCFALVWVKDKLYGLNASGHAPELATPEYIKEQGYSKMPVHGWTPVTVPGAVSGWVELSKRFGKLEFEELFEPAIYYAENGYPVSPVISKLWQDEYEAFLKIQMITFMMNGRKFL
ncbi:MAG: gamma-glutamyltransferase [Intestinibacter bartlettii]